MTQPASKRLLTEAAAAAQAANPATPLGGALNATFADKAVETTKADRVVSPVPAYTKTYDPQITAYNLRRISFDGLRAALAKARAGTGLASIACIGTSITAGHSAVAGVSDWPTFLRDRFKSEGVPIAGTGLVPCHHADSPRDNRWGYVGVWTIFTTGAFLRTPIWKTAAAGATATFTSDLPGTIAELWYSDTSGPFTVSIDGGAAEAITPVSAGGTILKWSKTGLTDTTHTVTVTRTSGETRIVGAGVRKATGLVVHNLGMGGSDASDVWQGATDYSPLKLAVNHLAADVTIMEGQTNEARNAVTTGTYESRLDDIIGAIPTSPSGMKKFLPIANIPANGLDLAPYRTSLYKKADAANFALLDMFDRWQQWGVSNALGYFADAYHPTAAGNSDYSIAVHNVLTRV